MCPHETLGGGVLSASGRLSAGATTTRPGGARDEVGYLVVEDERLFTVVHHPNGPARSGVVIVSPLLAELVPNYRREVALARRLADAGCVVARFHPRGSGRSTGDPATVTFASMTCDAAEVVDHVASLVEGQIALVGTRVGATVAAAAAPGAPVAAWAPVMDHRRYLREVFRSLYLHALKEDVTPPSDDLADRLARDGLVDIFGYAVHRALYDSLMAVDPHALLAGVTPRALLVDITTSGRPAATTQRMARQLAQGGTEVDVEVVEGQEAWWFSTSGGRRRPADPSEGLVATTSDWVLRMKEPHRVH